MGTWPTYSDGYREGYRAGQLAMRERAAVKARYWYDDDSADDSEGATVEQLIELLIRALEPEEPK